METIESQRNIDWALQPLIEYFRIQKKIRLSPTPNQPTAQLDDAGKLRSVARALQQVCRKVRHSSARR